MLNRAFPASPEELPRHKEGYDRADLARAGQALIQLDAWCRQRGLGELANIIERAADWADERLTDG